MADFDIKITDNSKIQIKDGSKVTIKDDSRLGITELQKIAPIATHIKEVNRIDPLRIEEFHLNELKNIEPIRIEKFNVTNLPMVNVALRQLPAVDMNIRRLPPVSVGLHQDFQVPSNYLVRGLLFGIELFRIQLNGETRIIPRDRYRREQSRTPNRSFPRTAAAGDPAIPSVLKEKFSEIRYVPHGCGERAGHFTRGAPNPAPRGKSRHSTAPLRPNPIPGVRTGGNRKNEAIHYGQPPMNIRMSGSRKTESFGESSVSTGE